MTSTTCWQSVLALFVPIASASMFIACSGMEEGGKPMPTVEAPPSRVPAVVAIGFGVHSIPPGAVWARESIHPLEWDVPVDLGPVDESVSIEESRDAGATWTFVENSETAGRYYRYRAPADATARIRVRILFRRSDERGRATPLRSLETPDIPLSASQKRSYTWTRVAQDAPFGPRDGAGGVVFGGKLWLFGGWNGSRFPLTTANDVWSSLDGGVWIQEKPNTFVDSATFDYASDWEGRHFAGYQVFDGKMWIVGGDVVQGHYQTDVWSSTDGRKWTRRDVHTTKPRMIQVTNPEDPRFGQYVADDTVGTVDEAQFGLRTLHITGVFDGRLFLMGGQRIDQFVNPVWPGAPAKVFNDVWTSADGANWSQVPTSGAMWAPRGLVSEAVELDGRMWLVGGGTYDDVASGRVGREYRNDVWSTRDGAHWEQIPDSAPFSARIWHNVKVFDGRLWVIDGYDGSTAGQGRQADNLRDAWYSTDGKNWYEATAPENFVPRHAATVWATDTALYVGSGNAMGSDPTFPDATKWYADVWRLTRVP